MKRICIIFIGLIALVANAAVVTYTPDESSIFSNPERGYLTQLERRVSKSSPYCVKGQESALDSHIQKDNVSLVLVLYYLDNFKTTATLPDEILNAFDEDMQALRKKGLKCILRYAYTSSNSGETANDASLEIVKSHIAQLKSHWQKNADVIYVFQAGFVGAWGEWYYTNNFGNKVDRMNDSRRELVNTLLGAVPQDRYIQLRTPLFKTSFVGNTKPLTAEEAFSGTPKARLAHHNDAFLENYGEMGTYDDTAKQKPYLAQETLYVPIGGETCILDANVAKTNASYQKTTAEMSRMHWTFIKNSYSEVVTDHWREDGTFDELNRRMGYRFQLLSATLPDNASAGGKANVRFEIRNAGYAPLYNPRPAFLVLKSGNSIHKVQLQSDPRRWLPNDVVTTINEQITLPADIPAGTYDLYLALPDAYESLASNPKYSVRFANKELWDASTGFNRLNATISISSDYTPPVTPADAVSLPAILSKDNVSTYSDDMTFYQTDFFDFGPADGENTSRWAQWNVSLLYPGKYKISEEMATANGTGHSWRLQLFIPGGDTIATYSTEGTWGEGTLTYDDLWDLTGIAQGDYILRVQNVMLWGQPKLKSITLDYDGELPASVDNTSCQPAILNPGLPMYDVLGRQVDSSYKGFVIQNGHKYLMY